MLGKLLLCNSLMLAEIMELVEENYYKWLGHCNHSKRDTDVCGCWYCEDCDKVKKCVPCSMQE